MAILYRNLWNSGLIYAISFWGPYCAEKYSHKHFRMLFAPRQGGTSINEPQKEDTGKKSQDVLFSAGFVHSRSGTYCALLPGYFGLKFLPDTRHCVYWVLAEVWAPFSSHKIGNKFFIRHCQGWKEGSSVCETAWFFSWVNTHPFDLKFVPNSVEILGWNFRKKPFRKNFSEIL